MLVFRRIPHTRDILEISIFRPKTGPEAGQGAGHRKTALKTTKIDANDGQQARRTPEVGSADVSTEISSFLQRKPPQLMPRRSGKQLRKLKILTPGGSPEAKFALRPAKEGHGPGGRWSFHVFGDISEVFLMFSDRSNDLKNQNFSAPQASDLGRSSALSYPAREPPSGKVPASAGRPCLTKLGVPHRVFAD